MQEFQSFVYLDLQKTGSTFIADLLQRHCKELQVRFSKHSRVGQGYDGNKFYFISVRNPEPLRDERLARLYEREWLHDLFGC